MFPCLCPPALSCTWFHTLLLDWLECLPQDMPAEFIFAGFHHNDPAWTLGPHKPLQVEWTLSHAVNESLAVFQAGMRELCRLVFCRLILHFDVMHAGPCDVVLRCVCLLVVLFSAVCAIHVVAHLLSLRVMRFR